MLRFFIVSLAILILPTKGISQKLKAVTTTSFLADIATQIAGDQGDVQSVLPIGTDPHIYDPVPEDARKIAEAELLILNGLTLEGWLAEMIDNSGRTIIKVIATDGIEAIASSDHVGAVDPHAWMNPINVITYAANIRDGLIAARPSKASYFESRFQEYQEQLKAIDVYIRRRIEKIPVDKRILATSHDAFRYYGVHYGLEVESILGTSTEAEPTIGAYKALIDKLSKMGIPAVFVESTINPQLLRRLAKDLGIVIGGELFADSLGDEESGADTYLKMIRQNTDVIVNGLLGLSGKDSSEDAWFILVIIGVFALSFLYVAYKMQLRKSPNIDWKDYSLNINGISVSYDRKTALSNIYLNIESGHVYGLLGGNGSGKSTLFKSILGLVEPDSGTVSLGEFEIDDVRKHISYIPQKEEIDWTFPATVMDIVLMGRYPHRKVFERLTQDDKSRADMALRQLGIEDLKNKQIGELSGGQQQRTFIARALCQDAEVFLFDEPFVGVDITTESRIMDIVRSLAAAGKLVIIIHHDLAKVKEYFDRVIMINQRVVAYGDTEEVFTDDAIQKTYGGQLTILQKTEHYK